MSSVAQAWISTCGKELITQGILGRKQQQLSNKPQTVALVMCSTELKRVVADLKSHFPSNTLHGFALKANFLKSVLQLLEGEGMGGEVASFGEFTLAKSVFPGNKIIYDSPTKTQAELEEACYSEGTYLNLDNFQELERVERLNAQKPVRAVVGIRINPQLASMGKIANLSTGMATSKFGVGLLERRHDLISAFQRNKFLTMLHVHTGSQGVGIPMMVQGVAAIVGLAEEIGEQITTIDIGGGLPVNFTSGETTPTFEEYANALKANVPHLFRTITVNSCCEKTGEESNTPVQRYKILTEFGRTIVAKAGVIASEVEYTKVSGGRRLIHQHVGADLAVRTIWAPSEWKLRVSIVDGETGEERDADCAETDVAGPCCLGGDLTVKQQNLPASQPGDLIVHKDVGGYFHSGYSTYNLRPPPACYFYNSDTKEFTLIKKAVTVEQLLELMS